MKPTTALLWAIIAVTTTAVKPTFTYYRSGSQEADVIPFPYTEKGGDGQCIEHDKPVLSVKSDGVGASEYYCVYTFESKEKEKGKCGDCYDSLYELGPGPEHESFSGSAVATVIRKGRCTKAQPCKVPWSK